MDMEMLKILVPSFISILGFFITIVTIRIQFNDAKRQKNTDVQRKIYLEAYLDIEKVITDNYLIFDRRYYEAIFSHKGEIKLSASDNVIREYEKYLRFVFVYVSEANDWVDKNDPEKKESNLIKIDESSEYTEEMLYVTSSMLDKFEYDYEEYKKNHVPESKKIKEYVETLLNKMRDDLGNDKYNFKKTN